MQSMQSLEPNFEQNTAESIPTAAAKGLVYGLIGGLISWAVIGLVWWLS